MFADIPPAAEHSPAAVHAAEFSHRQAAHASAPAGRAEPTDNFHVGGKRISTWRPDDTFESTVCMPS
ncbi:hypothetical protein [Streptomyces cacaoi]|uniref:hypothetical protein n=1 Tax=Streptomyces cacaoi TaxID=1898 RepID=UPI0011F2F85C|nr:hypothetical protein [Streptomyces cacaoi]